MPLPAVQTEVEATSLESMKTLPPVALSLAFTVTALVPTVVPVCPRIMPEPVCIVLAMT